MTTHPHESNQAPQGPQGPQGTPGPPQRYDAEYYKRNHDSAVESATIVMKEILPLVKPKIILDVGCGSGAWIVGTRIAAESGKGPYPPKELIITGWDKTDIPNEALAIRKNIVFRMDIADAIPPDDRQADLVICLEVAEHIDEEHAATVVNNLCSLAPVILFSAAIPGQGGRNHVNEQWPNYWKELFDGEDYVQLDSIRSRFWNHPKVRPDYAQNGFLYVKDKFLASGESPVAELLRDEPRSNYTYVHPTCFMGMRELAARALEKKDEAPPQKTMLKDRAADAAPGRERAIPHVFFGVPCGTQFVDVMLPNAIVNAIDDADAEVSVAIRYASALTANFNQLWTEALEARKKHGVTHFVMLHNDIRVVTKSWLQILLDLLSANPKWQVISVMNAIKDAKGLTSTALDTHPWRPRRITTTEALGKLPVTFDNSDIPFDDQPSGPLLINTGLWIADLSCAWCDDIVFDINNNIIIKPDRTKEVLFEPEDWHFSRQLKRLGVGYAVTRAVETAHVGTQVYRNSRTWGWETDKQNIPLAGKKGDQLQ